MPKLDHINDVLGRVKCLGDGVLLFGGRLLVLTEDKDLGSSSWPGCQSTLGHTLVL